MLWVYGNEERVQGRVESCRAPLAGEIVVVVGSASSEGPRPAEEARAARRAVALAEAIATGQAGDASPAIYTLNLGQEIAPRVRNPRSGPELRVLRSETSTGRVRPGWRDDLARDVGLLFPEHSTCQLRRLDRSETEPLDCW